MLASGTDSLIPRLDLERRDENEDTGSLSVEGAKERDDIFSHSTGVEFGEEVSTPIEPLLVRPEQRRIHYVLRE